MVAPAEFVVVRHKLSHPEDSQAELARHSHLAPSVVSRVEARLRAADVWSEHELLERLRGLPRRPEHRRVHFQAPNPELWFREYRGPYLQSGEHVAAAVDRLDVVPSKVLAYVPGEEWDAALRAAIDIFGKVSPASQGNLEIRVADPWLSAGQQPNVVERGQRLLDYLESKHIQLLRSMSSDPMVAGPTGDDGVARRSEAGVDVSRLLRARRREILEVCARHGASNVCVFGSAARGEATPSSDVDFLVDLEPGRSLLDHIGLQQGLEDLLGVRVDVVTRRGLHPLLREGVLAEAVPV